MTAAGHDSITATPEEPAAFGLPYHPLLGRYRVPSEKTLRHHAIKPDEPGKRRGPCLDHSLENGRISSKLRWACLQ
jgi:hypothetical protein